MNNLQLSRSASAASPLLEASISHNHNVYNHHHEYIGPIQDFILNVVDLRIEYAVMSFAPLLGVQDKFFLVPWSAIVIDNERDIFILPLDRDILKSAPGFARDAWPATTDAVVINDVNMFYEIMRH